MMNLIGPDCADAACGESSNAAQSASALKIRPIPSSRFSASVTGLGQASKTRVQKAPDAGPGAFARYLSGTTAVTSTSTIMPGHANWLIVSSVWAGIGVVPNTSDRHLPKSG